MYVTQKDIEALMDCMGFVQEAIECGAEMDTEFYSDAHKLLSKMKRTQRKQDERHLVNKYVRKAKKKIRQHKNKTQCTSYTTDQISTTLKKYFQ